MSSEGLETMTSHSAINVSVVEKPSTESEGRKKSVPQSAKLLEVIECEAKPSLKSMKLLFVAFACEPGRGSEPGIGWNFVDEASRRRPVWVITHASFRNPIEAYLKTQHRYHPITPIYVRLPGLLWLWNSYFGVNIYYYFWQFVAARSGRKAHRREGFDLIQHVSFERYWMHSAASSIGAPFIFGPVGGGENWPTSMRSEMPLLDRVRARFWSAIRAAMELDPFLKKTLRRAEGVIPSVDIVGSHLRRLGIKPLEVMASVAPKPKLPPIVAWTVRPEVFRFISIGRVPRWKAVHLGIKAFAKAFGPKSNQPNAKVEYVIIGEGEDLGRLKELTIELGLESQIRFEGNLPYDACLKELSAAGALIHPAFRDSAGLIFESLMLGIPVACLDIGLPALLIDSSCGVVLETENGAQAVVQELSDSMIRWEQDDVEHARIREGAFKRAEQMSREKRGERLELLYESVLSNLKSTQGNARGFRAKSFHEKMS